MSHRARHQLLALPGIIFLVLFPIILSLWIAFFWAKSEVNKSRHEFPFGREGELIENMSLFAELQVISSLFVKPEQ